MSIMRARRFKTASRSGGASFPGPTAISKGAAAIVTKLGVIRETEGGGRSFALRWAWLEDLCDQAGIDAGDVLEQFADKMSDRKSGHLGQVASRDARQLSVTHGPRACSEPAERL